VLEDGTDLAVVDNQAVRVEVDAHLVVQLGAGAGGVHVDGEQAVVASLDLGVQLEVDEEDSSHVLDVALVGVEVAIHGPEARGLPVAVRLVGPDDQEADRLDGEARALAVVGVELDDERAQILAGLLAAAGGALGLRDGEGVGHDRLAVDGGDLELTLGLFDLDDAGLVLVLLDDLAVLVRGLLGLDLLHDPDLGLGGVGLAGGEEGQADEGDDGTHGNSDADVYVGTCCGVDSFSHHSKDFWTVLNDLSSRTSCLM
jgi:hypothetical protein